MGALPRRDEFGVERGEFGRGGGRRAAGWHAGGDLRGDRVGDEAVAAAAGVVFLGTLTENKNSKKNSKKIQIQNSKKFQIKNSNSKFKSKSQVI